MASPTESHTERQRLKDAVAQMLLDLILMPPKRPKGEQQAFAARLSKQTDLGCVLVASAHIEQQLGKLLHAYFERSASLSGTAINATALDAAIDGDDAFLRDFSVRTRLAYALGLIPKHTKESLGAFRRGVRNKFAHNVVDDHAITDATMNTVLKDLDAERRGAIAATRDMLGDKLMDPRNRFTYYAIAIWTELHRTTQRLSEGSGSFGATGP